MSGELSPHWRISVVHALRDDVTRARAAATRDERGSSGLYYWTGYADALQVALHAIETGEVQPPLPMT